MEPPPDGEEWYCTSDGWDSRPISGGRAPSPSGKIAGTVTWSDNRAPASGLMVEAWDSDVAGDDKMGSGVTNTSGKYSISYQARRWDPTGIGDSTENPDVYIRVKHMKDRKWLDLYVSRRYEDHRLPNELTIDAVVDRASQDQPPCYDFHSLGLHCLIIFETLYGCADHQEYKWTGSCLGKYEYYLLDVTRCLEQPPEPQGPCREGYSIKKSGHIFE